MVPGTWPYHHASISGLTPRNGAWVMVTVTRPWSRLGFDLGGLDRPQRPHHRPWRRDLDLHRVMLPGNRWPNCCDRDRWRFLLLMTHETPEGPRVRALPSPVCTAPVVRQSQRQETVTDRGECPAQRPYAMWFVIKNVHRLRAAFPTLTRGVCCPSAAEPIRIMVEVAGRHLRR